MKICGGLIALLVLAAVVGASLTARDSLESGRVRPPIQNLVQVTLERGVCFGRCPDYGINIFADGRVEYSGRQFVKVEGMRSKNISAVALGQLRDELNRAGYFGLHDLDTSKVSCEHPSTDYPTVTISVRAEGKVKSVKHYRGCDGPDSALLSQLEDGIDLIAGTVEWVGTLEERRKLR